MLNEISWTEKENTIRSHTWNIETKQKHTKTSLKIQRTDWCLPAVGLEVSKMDEGNPEV